MPHRPARLLPVLILSLAAVTPAAALPPASDHWIEARTDHFVLYSDAAEKFTREVGRRLETFRDVLGRLNPELSVDSPLPTSIYVFVDDHAFEPYKRRVGSRPSDMDGYFVAHRDGNYVAVNASPEGDPFLPVYHEYVHFFMNTNFADLPLWFNEGIAEFYSTMRLTTDGVEVGHPLGLYARFLHASKPMRLSALMAVTIDSPAYNERLRQGVFYAESWALVHYLIMDAPGWRENLVQRLRRLDRGEPLEALVAPLDLETLQDRFYEYIKRGRYRFNVIDLKTLAPDDRARVTPMSRPDVLYRLGDFLAHGEGNRGEEAEAHFRAALALDPRHAPSLAGLGFLRDQQGRFQEATGYYERALALAPNDPRVCALYAGSLMLRHFKDGVARFQVSDATPPDFARARALFIKSLRLGPPVGESYAGLGSTYAFDRTGLGPGIAALETAHRMLPSRHDVVYNLVGLYARNGDRDKAHRLVEEVLDRGGDPRLAAEARESILAADLVAAEALVRQDRIDEALAIYEQVAATTADAALKQEVERQIGTIMRTVEHNRQIDRYNSAIEKARARDYAGARVLADQVAREAADPDLARKARELLKKIDDAAPARDAGRSRN
jgi:tetratricopeptide (TPR) repeat protein